MKDYDFGNFLCAQRKRCGLSQYQLGKLVGVSDKAVSKWENGYSKPQSQHLYKLSSILGISVDELLSHRHKPNKNVLWKKAYQTLLAQYGKSVSVEISNRYFSEFAELKETDVIIYFDLISQLNSMAKSCNQHIYATGATGSSFVAFLLGATEINPLKPHYFCPHCKAVEFDASVCCGWDLPVKRCNCGREYLRDGHNLPFETLRFSIHKNTKFNIHCSSGFCEVAKEKIGIYNESIIKLVNSKELDKLCLLEEKTNTSLNTIVFTNQRILEAFQSINTDGIPEFESDYLKGMMKESFPKSFHDLIQILGLSHTNCETPISPTIAYRDDVFNYIQDKIIENRLSNTGFAHKVMDDIRRGVFAKEGLSQEIKDWLLSLGVEEWFIDSISNVRYLFPKAHGAVCVKYALVFMWYKLNYREIFDKVFLC